MKIVEAIAATRDSRLGQAQVGLAPRGSAPAAGAAVGPRLPKVDGGPRVLGTARFGPTAARWGSRAARHPVAARASEIRDRRPRAAPRAPSRPRRGADRADVPGQNRYGIYATGKDQPALADGIVRHRGEAVLALVGDERTVASIDEAELPITWHVAASAHVDQALAEAAPRLHDRPRATS